MATRPARLVHEECEGTVVNMTDNTTTVNTGPTLLVGIYVNIVLTAAAVEIENISGTTVATLPASLAAGTHIPFNGLFFNDALIINPDDAAASGQILVLWRNVIPD